MEYDTSKTRDNHYVPQWYQRGFLVNNANQLYYLDLDPDKKTLSDGREIIITHLRRKSTVQCFVQRDLYTTFFGQYINDEIEKKLFGKIDDTGARATRAFLNEDVGEWIHHFPNFISYIDSQKIRTPKGLDWIKKHYSKLNQVDLMKEMQAIKNMHGIIWSEGVREIVSAKSSKIKFILTDHPVTVYNYACSPESKECAYPDDPSIALKGTQTIYPLNMDFCLIFTNYEYAMNPDEQNPIEKRTNPRFMRNGLVRADAFIKKRFLSEEEVMVINLIFKQRARKYIASSNKDWLFPEKYVKFNWSECKNILLPPKSELHHFGGEIFAGYKDGSTYYQDAYGRTTPENKFLKKQNRTSTISRNDYCGCGSGKKYKFCCERKEEKLRPSWDVLSIRERNLSFYKGINKILGIDKGKTWDDVRRELSNDQVKDINGLFEFLWPAETDIFSLFPKPDNELRALYTGIVDPRVIARIALGLSPYFNEILIEQPFIHPSSVKPEFSPIHSPHQHKQQTLKNVLLLHTLIPFIEAGFINFIPDPCYFDPHLHRQILNMSKERTQKYKRIEKEDDLFKELAKQDMMRTVLQLSKEQKIAHIKNILPRLSALEIEEMIRHLEKNNLEDPLTLLQDNVYNEKKGQFVIMNLAPNFEMSLYIAQMTGSILLTDSPFRWLEINDAQYATEGVISYPYEELSNSINNLDLMLADNLDSIYRNRIGSSYNEIRKSIKNIFNAINNNDKVPVTSILDKLKHGLLNSREIFRQKENNERRSSDIVKMNCLIPQGGFIDNNVQRLLLTSGSENHLSNVPIAIFAERA